MKGKKCAYNKNTHEPPFCLLNDMTLTAMFVCYILGKGSCRPTSRGDGMWRSKGMDNRLRNRRLGSGDVDQTVWNVVKVGLQAIVFYMSQRSPCCPAKKNGPWVSLLPRDAGFCNANDTRLLLKPCNSHDPLSACREHCKDTPRRLIVVVVLPTTSIRTNHRISASFRTWNQDWIDVLQLAPTTHISDSIIEFILYW